MRRSYSRCPECGEPASQFAAGCAICGADLEAHRRYLADRRAAAPAAVLSRRVPAWVRRGTRALSERRTRGDVHMMRLAFAIVLALFAPLLGLLLAAWFAYLADGEGRAGIRNALIAVCGFAFTMLYFAPFSIWALVL